MWLGEDDFGPRLQFPMLPNLWKRKLGRGCWWKGVMERGMVPTPQKTTKNHTCDCGWKMVDHVTFSTPPLSNFRRNKLIALKILHCGTEKLAVMSFAVTIGNMKLLKEYWSMWFKVMACCFTLTTEARNKVGKTHFYWKNDYVPLGLENHRTDVRFQWAAVVTARKRAT